MSEYRLISSDSHVFEPEDLWEKRIDPRFKDRAPYVAHEEDTDQWYADGDFKFAVVGANAQAGLRFENPDEITWKGRFTKVPLGGMDPHAHVRDMELDGVAGGVIYPSTGLGAFTIPAGDLLSAIFSAYNDWLGEFCRPYPDRLKGIAMINVDNVTEAVAELERTAKLGLVGAMISVKPLGRRYSHPDYAPLWAAAQDLNMPLSLHVATGRWRPNARNEADPVLEDPFVLLHDTNNVKVAIADMIFAGVFEDYPRLKAVAVEYEIAWAPYLLRRMDNNYTEKPVEQRGSRRFKNGALPSDFFRSNVSIGFQEDDLGIQLRHYVGVDALLWGSDYPHAESTFPRSREIVDRILQDIPEDEKAKIAGENTARLYRFN